MPQMPSLRFTIAKNTMAQLLGRIIGSLSTLAITVYVARALGATGYGDFVKVTTFVSFFYLLADFGLNAEYIKRSSTEKTNSSWMSLVTLRALLCGFLILCAFAIVSLLPRHSTDGYTDIVRMGIVLLLPTVFFQAIITSTNGLFQKLLRYELSAYAILSGSIVSLITVWVLTAFVLQPSLALSLTPLLFGSAITALAGIWFVKRSVLITPIHQKFSEYRSFFIASIPLGLTLVFNVIYFHIDSVVLTLTRPTQEVGIYGLAYKVFEVALVFPTFFMNSVYPVMVQKNIHSLKTLIFKSACFLFLVSSLLSFVMWFCAPLLTLIKHDFMFSIPALRILVLGLPFFFLSSLMMWVLITIRKQNILVGIYGVSMIINIILNIIFVPNGGYISAAWITVFSEGFVLLASSVVVLKNI